MKAFRGHPAIFSAKTQSEHIAELEIRKLSLSFGGIMALNDLSLRVHTGELVAVIGPNGAGKTSLLNCITGFYRAQKGNIFFNEKDITHLPTHELIHVGIGRTFQNIELFPGMSVLSNMLLARHNHCHYKFTSACLFSKSVRKEEIRHRQILEELIDFLEMQAIRKKKVSSSPYGLM